MPSDLGDLLNSTNSHRVRPPKEDVWKVIVGLIAFFTVITLYAFEFDYFSRTFHISTLLWIAAVLGAIVAYFLARSFFKSLKTLLEKIQIALFFIFIGAITMPLLASLTNRWLTYHPKQVEQVEFVELKPFKQSRFGLTKEELQKGLQPSGYYLFFVRNNRIERIPLKKPLFQDAKRSEMISLTFQKGLWGYEWIVIE